MFIHLDSSKRAGPWDLSLGSCTGLGRMQEGEMAKERLKVTAWKEPDGSIQIVLAGLGRKRGALPGNRPWNLGKRMALTGVRVSGPGLDGEQEFTSFYQAWKFLFGPDDREPRHRHMDLRKELRASLTLLMLWDDCHPSHCPIDRGD